MNSSATARVLHLVPPNGGGVDRFVRDLSAERHADWLLHISDEQCVVEAPQQDLMVPIAFDALAALVERGALGRAAALHAHSTVPAVRRAIALLADKMDLRYVVTLHDVEFAGAPDTDPDERAQRLDFVRRAARCTVPSRFIQGLALQAMGDSFVCTVVENGVERHEERAAVGTAGKFPVAVVGAIGKHKGLDQLIEVAGKLPADAAIVLFGYADGQLSAGWLVEGKIWVHGAFEPAQLPQLVARYGSVLAFFPKGQPESYCYALSDAWLAGLPVVAPDSGAIGERVRAHGGGALYDPQATAGEVASTISRCLSEPGAGFSSVEHAVSKLNSIATMLDSMNTIYSEILAPESAPDLEALRRSMANHLDSRFFRRELLRLQGDIAALAQQREDALRELDSLGENYRKRGEWIDQLQATGDGLQEDCRKLQQIAATLEAELETLRPVAAALDALQVQHATLQADRAALLQEHAQLSARYERLLRPLKWPLRFLPAGARAWAVKAAKRFFNEGRNG